MTEWIYQIEKHEFLFIMLGLFLCVWCCIIKLWELKNIYFYISLALAITCLSLGIYGIYKIEFVQAQYCGKVIKMYSTEAGYKIPNEQHIVFYCNSLKRNVDVRVCNNTYCNIKEGQKVCFDLTINQLNK